MSEDPHTVPPLLFTLEPHPLFASLAEALPATRGALSRRHFPDGESYLRIDTAVAGRHCMVLADLTHADERYLPLMFLLSTLRELGASSIGLVAPYLGYMRQDKRFHEGEAVTSRIFAAQLSQHVDWLVTVDPHLHRYQSLAEIYRVPTRVVHAAPVLAKWLQGLERVFLVGPDEESRQWTAEVARLSGHPFVIGNKQRSGDRDVTVTLPDLAPYSGMNAVIIDDVISSGQTIIKCIDVLRANHIDDVSCAAVHGLYADESDTLILERGVSHLIASNSIPHFLNTLDITALLAESMLQMRSAS